MPFIKVYIHFVWSTKNRYPYLSTLELRKKVWKHIHKNAEKKEIFVDFVGGYDDHCHCLVSLKDTQTIRKIVQLIKGESSYWINKELFLEEKFEWQDEFWAVSVSESNIEKVRNYIRNQEKHHAKKSWNDEYREFVEKYGFVENA
ncbi:MAG: IS200/IS605 family transposase [Paludibacter sp.]|nr:IS200/IS605 family transposase [Paludibacter sp.]MDD4428380.1 IS200/IS605 family transposase [Paludibacter sp.]